MTSEPNWLGWYDTPDATTPAHEPGLEVPCPVCLHPLGDGTLRKTVSLMAMRRGRSWFFRVHARCSDDQGAMRQIEGSIIDAEAAAETAPETQDE